MNGKTHLRQMACALFSLYGYEQFSAVKALTLTKHQDLKAMVTFHYAKDVDGHGNYFQFVKNPLTDGIEVKSGQVLEMEIKALELKIYTNCLDRVTHMKDGNLVEARALDRIIEYNMHDMMRKTDEYLK